MDSGNEKIDYAYLFLSGIRELGQSLKSDEVKSILGEDDHKLLCDILRLAYKKVYENYGK